MSIPNERNRAPDMYPPSVAITEEQRSEWQSALIRATESRLTLSFCGVMVEPGSSRELHAYRVSSSTRPALSHRTEVIVNDGQAESSECSCEAGMSGQPCRHVAAVINHLSAWPFAIGRQTEMEIT